MIASRNALIVSLALVRVAAAGHARAQETEAQGRRPRLLLEKLDDRRRGRRQERLNRQAVGEGKRAETETGRPAQGSKDGAGSKALPARPQRVNRPRQQAIEAQDAWRGDVAPKDQAIDDLLEKLGESKDDTRPGRASATARRRRAEEPKEPPAASKAGPAKLGGKDKEIDEHSRSSPAESGSEVPPTTNSEPARSARSSRRCATSSSGSASPTPARTPRTSRSRSSSASRH